MRKFSWLVGCLIVVVLGVFVFNKFNNSQQSSNKSSQASSAKNTDLPDAKTTDWNLVIVNRQNPRAEMNPDLTTVENVQVDRRIAPALTQFLAAARAIDPAEHLISGYRSVAYQTNLYNNYVAKEMAGAAGTVNAGGSPISKSQAEKNVQTYSQPPTMSEHETGLAVDMSTVDELDASPAAIVKKVAAIAPKYGFILRFPADGKASTGVGYEDWHYRYVGVDNAKYIVKHHLTLEEYVKLLKK